MFEEESKNFQDSSWKSSNSSAMLIFPHPIANVLRFSLDNSLAWQRQCCQRHTGTGFLQGQSSKLIHTGLQYVVRNNAHQCHEKYSIYLSKSSFVCSLKETVTVALGLACLPQPCAWISESQKITTKSNLSMSFLLQTDQAVVLYCKSISRFTN